MKAAVLAAALLAGCATLPAERGTWQACMSGIWESPEQIKVLCGKASSQACLLNGQLIVSRKPVDWKDTYALHALGHEVAHVLKLNLGKHDD